MLLGHGRNGESVIDGSLRSDRTDAHDDRRNKVQPTVETKARTVEPDVKRIAPAGDRVGRFGRRLDGTVR